MTDFSISGGGSAFGKETWVVAGRSTAEDAETSTDAPGSSNSPVVTGPGRTEESFRSGGKGGPSCSTTFAFDCGGGRGAASSGGGGASLGSAIMICAGGCGASTIGSGSGVGGSVATTGGGTGADSTIAGDGAPGGSALSGGSTRRGAGATSAAGRGCG